ncbi:hypothetical protein HETIRDRAFT_429423 [Heterobasidion irregulare TC 32-1]|uniref:Uncharacterized protein n=1 Tax=Heterobasidion irregulare (strain TC 32-1) TaxID=747525 RepID=W4JU82_HETIT|nr:uncharacterized protein HETIRDRAFT_429423 [Heterobasidion irregulare TC 32-1]ETW77019.1 hypothetical protein HETIRDRAFT_429423 [Heterobasidion irregulare TC 32-1]
MFSSGGSAASRAHSVFSVRFCETSRPNPALTTTWPKCVGAGSETRSSSGMDGGRGQRQRLTGGGNVDKVLYAARVTSVSSMSLASVSLHPRVVYPTSPLVKSKGSVMGRKEKTKESERVAGEAGGGNEEGLLGGVVVVAKAKCGALVDLVPVGVGVRVHIRIRVVKNP